jgi:hypothetical protein
MKKTAYLVSGLALMVLCTSVIAFGQGIGVC